MSGVVTFDRPQTRLNRDPRRFNRQDAIDLEDTTTTDVAKDELKKEEERVREIKKTEMIDREKTDSELKGRSCS